MRNASWMLLGQIANLLLQAAYFLLLARLLGAEQYGIYAGAFALVNTIAPYSALGSGMLFMRYVSKDKALAGVYWGNMLIVTSVVSTIATSVLFFLGPALTATHSSLLFLTVTLSNCFFIQISLLASKVFQTFERMQFTALLNFLANLVRFIVLLLSQALLHHATAVQWSISALIASIFSAALSLIWVRSAIGTATFSGTLLLRRAWEGVGYSFAGTTQAVYNDLDKAMLSRYGLNRENGFYTLAYRIVDFAAAPIGALDAALLPRYFRLNHENLRSLLALALKSAGTAALLGLVISCSLRLVSSFIPHFVGADFQGVVDALKWLCWIPPLRGIHSVTGSALTGSGRQNTRTVAQFVVALVNVGLNLWWIPIYGWLGAAWSSVLSDGLLGILNLILLLSLWRRVSKGEAEAVCSPVATNA